MRRGLSLTELAAKIEAQRELKHDLIVPSVDLRASVHDDNVVVLQVPDTASGGEFPLRPTAHQQLGSHIGIPKPYYDRMLAETPELLTRNINTWLGLADPTERRMVRTLGGDARAFLSNRYQRIENEEIASVVLPVLLKQPDLEIVASEVTERKLYIQAVSKRLKGDVRKGDVVQAGVQISNSEIGFGAASVAALAWRLACLNGMIVPDGKLQARHVGGRIDSSEALWKQDTIQADDRAILLKIRDSVDAALDEAMFAKRIDRMRTLAGIEFDKGASVERGVEVLAKKVGATEDERGGILQALIKGGDLSAWGLINALTYQAHATESFDRAIELEAAGGKLLEMGHGEWREILDPALAA